MQCSAKKLKLGESSSWKKTGEHGRPLKKQVRHTHQERTPDHFCKVLLQAGLEVLLIPGLFRPWFDGECPDTIKLKPSTTCIWDVDVKEQDGKIVLDGGWPEFVSAHDLKIGYFLVFKKLDTRSLKVLVFDYTCCEKVIKCAGYHPSLEEEHVSQPY